MAGEIEKTQKADTYFVADTSLFPPGRITLTLDASYDAFARRYGAGECHVRISLPNGSTFETPGSVAIINTADPVSARPHVMLYHPPQLSALPKSSTCTVLPK